MIVKYTKAEFDALIEKKLKEAIETGFKERSQFTKKELLEQIIEIDDEGEESLLAWEEAKEAELDEKVASYERKVEKEEDERDLKEKKRKEKERERKRLNTVYRRQKNEEFYEACFEKIKSLKNLIPETENSFEGVGKTRKFKANFRRQGTLFLQEIKNLNIGGGDE